MTEFASVLYNILDELNAHKRDRQEFMTQCIKDRLNKSVETYYKELSQSLEYLHGKNEKNILKKLDKEG